MDHPERLQQVRRNLERHKRILPPAGSGHSNLLQSPLSCGGKEVEQSPEYSEGPASTISERGSDVPANEYLEDQVTKPTYWDMDDAEVHQCDCPNCPYRSLDNLDKLEDKLQTLYESSKDDLEKGSNDSSNSVLAPGTLLSSDIKQLTSTSSTSTSSSSCELHIIRDYESVECHTGESESDGSSSTRPLIRYSCTPSIIEIPDSPDHSNRESEDEEASNSLSPFPIFCEEVQIVSPSTKSPWVIYEPILSAQPNVNGSNQDAGKKSLSSSISNAGSYETSQPDSDYPREMKAMIGRYPFSFPSLDQGKIRLKARYAACWLEELFGVSSKERRDKLEEIIVDFFDPDKRDFNQSPVLVVEDTTELPSLAPATLEEREETDSEKEKPYQHLITVLARKNLVQNPQMGWETALQSAAQSMSWYSGMLTRRSLYDEKLTTRFEEESVIEFFELEKWMEEK
jgi:hypothetical protein